MAHGPNPVKNDFTFLKVKKIRNRKGRKKNV